MARAYISNAIYATFGALMYAFKTLMISQGWTVPYSSDGTTYNPSGDQITHGGSGAGGMYNNRAWFALRCPAGVREFIFQMQNTATPSQLRVKYAATGFHLTGSPGATQTPGGVNSQPVYGVSGTDAAPAFAVFFETNARWHLCADNTAPAAPNNAFYFHIASTIVTTGVERYGIAFDSVKATTHSDIDGDPAVFWQTTPSTGYWTAFYWQWFGSVAPVWKSNVTTTQPPPFFSYTAVLDPNNRDVSMPYNINDGTSWKGLSGNLRIKGNLRTYPNTVNKTGDARMYFKSSLIPYEPNVDPLL